jgi:hypothetical protein
MKHRNNFYIFTFFFNSPSTFYIHYVSECTEKMTTNIRKRSNLKEKFLYYDRIKIKVNDTLDSKKICKALVSLEMFCIALIFNILIAELFSRIQRAAQMVCAALFCGWEVSRDRKQFDNIKGKTMKQVSENKGFQFFVQLHTGVDFVKSLIENSLFSLFEIWNCEPKRCEECQLENK